MRKLERTFWVTAFAVAIGVSHVRIVVRQLVDDARWLHDYMFPQEVE